MKKFTYLLLMVFICFSCTEKDYHKAALEADEKLNETAKLYDAAETDEEKEKLDKAWEVQFEEAKQAYADYFAHAINTPEGQKEFETQKWTRRLTAEQLEKVLNNADESYKSAEFYQMQSKRLDNMKTSTSGNPYKEIHSFSPEGDALTLSQFIGNGNYVLLHFWASWCGPCREGTPKLVEIYEKHKGNNFQMIGFSLDNKEDAWRLGLEKLNMTWHQMSDCKGWESNAVTDYAVQSIPCTFIIDPEGKIIERGLYGDELAEKIDSLLK